MEGCIDISLTRTQDYETINEGDQRWAVRQMAMLTDANGLLTDGSEHQNGGNSKRQRVATRVETEHVTWAATNRNSMHV